MDPQAALYDLLDAINNGDREMVDEYLEALRDWVSKGGILPQVFPIQGVNGLMVYRKHKWRANYD
jgi:hypothetical protein